MYRIVPDTVFNQRPEMCLSMAEVLQEKVTATQFMLGLALKNANHTRLQSVAALDQCL
jgi:hypothetical protein